MNFLHVHTTDNEGGAAVSMHRFHNGLLKAGHGSRILCGKKTLDDAAVTQIVPTRLGYYLNRGFIKLMCSGDVSAAGYISSIFIRNSRLINEWADVACMRNVHGWYLPLESMAYMAEKIPVIWRMPDMWALTGHCAYSYDCDKWQDECRTCDFLDYYPELWRDISHRLWLKKKELYKKMSDRLVFVAPSMWLKDKIQSSPLTSTLRCEYIPSAVDMDVFKPMDRVRISSELGLLPDSPTLMFSAVDLKDKRKGVDGLPDIMNAIVKRLGCRVNLLISGYNKMDLELENVNVVFTGYIKDDRQMAECYSAADIYLSLSRADNLPNTLIEAAACGLPSVTYDSGGSREALIDKKSGFVASDREELSDILIKILSDRKVLTEMSINARTHAFNNFSMEKQVKEYHSLALELTGQ